MKFKVRLGHKFTDYRMELPNGHSVRIEKNIKKGTIQLYQLYPYSNISMGYAINYWWDCDNMQTAIQYVYDEINVWKELNKIYPEITVSNHFHSLSNDEYYSGIKTDSIDGIDYEWREYNNPKLNSSFIIYRLIRNNNTKIEYAENIDKGVNI